MITELCPVFPGDNGDENDDDVYNMDEDDDHVSDRCFNEAEELNQVSIHFIFFFSDLLR